MGRYDYEPNRINKEDSLEYRYGKNPKAKKETNNKKENINNSITNEDIFIKKLADELEKRKDIRKEKAKKAYINNAIWYALFNLALITFIFMMMISNAP